MKPTTGDPRALTLAAVLLAVGCVIVTQYGYALHVPFINDDYVFLDKTRGSSFLSLWLPRQLAFQWYRPWSRELHYWVLQRVFGLNEAPFHVVSLGLLLAVGAAYAAFARRVAGSLAAAIAVAGVFAMAAWAVPAVWIAGVQDLWMLLFGLLMLLATDQRRPVLATVACALALLSKETAAVLPAIAFMFVWLGRGRGVRAALIETGGLWLALVLWLAVHPRFGGSVWHPAIAGAAAAAEAVPHASPFVIMGRTLLSLFNLDTLPFPANGWRSAILGAWPAALALVTLVLLAIRTEAARPAARGALVFGAAWALLGWLPLFSPSVGWHSYYALLGACGAWLALGAVLAKRPAAAMALIATLTLVRSGRATTPSLDWGTEFYQTRSAAFLHQMHDDLLRLHPSVPAHSRMFFALIPSQVGFLAGDAPVLRVWYRDSTLSGGVFTQYTRRRDGDAGTDYFFRYEPAQGWIEIPSTPIGAGDSAAAEDAQQLATLFAKANDWPNAARQYERLAVAAPAGGHSALDAGVAHAMGGDRTAALAWLQRALAESGTADSTHALARRMITELRETP